MKKTILMLMIIAAWMLSGCNFPLLGKSQEVDSNLLATSVAQTVQAMESSIQPTATLMEQPTELPVLPTPTLPSIVPTGTAPTSIPKPCNKAEFVSETIPDDTEFDPGEGFKKTWTFKNVGTCIWSADYRMVFATGDAMGGPAAVNLTKTVAPNEQYTVEVNLKAPGNPGTYTGNWQLHDQSGENFFPVYVRIKVRSAEFAVTSVYTNLADVTGTCPYDYQVDVSIVASAAGKVTYKTENSEGMVSSIQTVKFDGAETRVVEFEWLDLAAGDHWLKVYIETPNNQWFGPFNFKVTCSP